MKKSFLAKTTTALGILFSSLALTTATTNVYAADDGKNVLYVYNWTEYIPSDLLKKFTEETGIEVRYSTYESNEELYSKLKLVNGTGYDVIFPSSYYIKLLKDDGLIQPIDKSKINMDNVNPSLLGYEYDPKNEFSLPYVYGFTVIGVNKDHIKYDEVKAWKDLWKPQYKNLTLLNDVLDDFSMALFASGVNPNKATTEQVDKAYEMLAELSKKTIQFNSDSPEIPYVEGQSDIGMIWTGSAFRAQKEGNTSIDVVYPSEGSILWIDNFAITKNAQNIDAAYKFINFILEPKNSAYIVEEMGFQTSSSKLKENLPKAWQENHILFPSEEVFKKAIINSVPNEMLQYYNNK